MTSRTHDLAAFNALAGVVLVTTSTQTITLATLLIAVLANQIGGITPDIDQPTAPFWRNLPIGGFFGRLIDKMLGGHRFITHSLIGLGVFGFLSQMLLHFLHPIMHSVNSHVVWLAFMIGMASHLVMDSFTKEGVPWLLPLPFKFGVPPIKSLRITTGKRAEALLFFALVTFDIWYCSTHYARLIDLFHKRIV
jgi:inner membrane protein